MISARRGARCLGTVPRGPGANHLVWVAAQALRVADHIKASELKVKGGRLYHQGGLRRARHLHL